MKFYIHRKINKKILKCCIDEHNVKTRNDFIYLYKGVTSNFYPSYRKRSGCHYKPGTYHETKIYNRHTEQSCGSGFNLCWTISQAKSWGPSILKVRVKKSDIICIPYNKYEAGKIRVRKMYIMDVVRGSNPYKRK